MKIGATFSVTEENFPEESSWIGNLLSPLTNTLGQMLLALQSNLSIGDNLIGVVSSYTFTTGAAYTGGTFTPIRIYWTPGNANLPRTVLVGQVTVPSTQATPLTAIAAHNWTYDYTSQSVIINYVAGLANSSTYTITFEVK